MRNLLKYAASKGGGVKVIVTERKCTQRPRSWRSPVEDMDHSRLHAGDRLGGLRERGRMSRPWSKNRDHSARLRNGGSAPKGNSQALLVYLINLVRLGPYLYYRGKIFLRKSPESISDRLLVFRCWLVIFRSWGSC